MSDRPCTYPSPAPEKVLDVWHRVGETYIMKGGCTSIRDAVISAHQHGPGVYEVWSARGVLLMTITLDNRGVA
jgi:hypothetical protein